MLQVESNLAEKCLGYLLCGLRASSFSLCLD